MRVAFSYKYYTKSLFSIKTTALLSLLKKFIKKNIICELKFIFLSLLPKNLTIMMNKKLLFLLLGSSMLSAQTINESAAATKVSGKTGINTKVPTRTLTIKNTTANQGKPVLRLVDTPKYSENINSAMDAALGGNTQSTTKHSDYRHLVVNSVGDVYQGIPMTNNTGIINLVVKQVDEDWIQTFDTGIDYNKYTVALLSYTLHTPHTESGKMPMLITSKYYPDSVINGKAVSKTIAPTVYLKNENGKWAIYADYPNVGLRNFTAGDESEGSKGYGDWEFYLLVGKKDYLPSQRMEFNMNKGVNGAGISDNTYKTRLENFLQKLD